MKNRGVWPHRLLAASRYCTRFAGGASQRRVAQSAGSLERHLHSTAGDWMALPRVLQRSRLAGWCSSPRPREPRIASLTLTRVKRRTALRTWFHARSLQSITPRSRPQLVFDLIRRSHHLDFALPSHASLDHSFECIKLARTPSTPGGQQSPRCQSSVITSQSVA